ncbi:MAG: NAD(P)/FAD-dependent oxidoreductase [Verrucomicrobiota bacterium]|jgi:NADH dehydrogenase
MEEKNAQVVVLGAGFGGLTFCQHFENRQARVKLVDRTNHHLFQPLLYQVATAGLSAPEVAQPIRSILSERANVTIFMEPVVDLNLSKREVVLQSKTLAYDYLVLALGGRNNYFGHPEWEQFAPGLKTLDDAVRIRSRVLLAFERAENTEADAEHLRLLSVIIIGGGPTGVELAGAFAELARRVLVHDFRHIDPAQAHIILIEGGPRILLHLPEDLSGSATRQLEKLGVQVRTGVQVKDIRRGEVELANGAVLRAENILWAAGVAASPLTQKLGVELDRAGRVKVNPDLSVPGHPEVFAIGDLAFVLQADGKPVPGVSPAAMQMARHVAKIIDHELAGIRTPRPPFKYWDKGTMATIGRSKAVAQVGALKMSGLVAWIAWLSLHLVFLIGFRNKVAVMLDWMYSYFAYKRGARIIMGESPDPLRENE